LGEQSRVNQIARALSPGARRRAIGHLLRAQLGCLDVAPAGIWLSLSTKRTLRECCVAVPRVKPLSPAPGPPTGCCARSSSHAAAALARRRPTCRPATVRRRWRPRRWRTPRIGSGRSSGQRRSFPHGRLFWPVGPVRVPRWTDESPSAGAGRPGSEGGHQPDHARLTRSACRASGLRPSATQ